VIDLDVQITQADEDASCIVYEVKINGEVAGSVDHIRKVSLYTRGKFASTCQCFRMNRGKEWGNYWNLGQAVGYIVRKYLNEQLSKLGRQDLLGK
jgi:hypothetical protein